VLPSLRKTNVFGGILTAVRIFQSFLSHNKVKGRMIVLSGESYNSTFTYNVKGFKPESGAKYSLFFSNDGLDIEIGKNDVFMLTSWKTAFIMMSVLKWQIKAYDLKNRKALYLIQDYEPGFYARSSEYVLAESTYHTDADLIYALFNSKELYDYFRYNDYKFYKEDYFEPTLNEKLKKHLPEKDSPRDKTILIYGRPCEPRNAFEIIKGALMIWSKEYPDAKSWNIISLGEYFGPIKLANNVIKSPGKVSLPEYAEIMKKSYVGISLMISPHPSYPPLEMSAFGIKTITNTFKNKDLSYFSENIVSISACTPREIANRLKTICSQYGKSESTVDLNSDYVKGESFDKTVLSVGENLYEMVKRD
jgi:hypothetical protein